MSCLEIRTHDITLFYIEQLYNLNIMKDALKDSPLCENVIDNVTELFRARYGSRLIGFDTVSVFIRRITGEIKEYTPIFIKSLESENLINNPFITVNLINNNTSNMSSGNENFNISRGKLTNDRQLNDVNIKRLNEYNDAKSNNANENFGEGKGYSVNMNDSNTRSERLFTDCPQSKAIEQGNDPNDLQYNHGYVTTKDLSTSKSHGQDSGKTEKYQKNSAVEVSNHLSSLNANEIANNQNNSIENENTYNDNWLKNVSYANNNFHMKKIGFTDKTVSSIILEYRKTFINSVTPFLDRLDDFFLQVY